ncbi:cache domain-containing protein [Albimonas sp. CAU 1670]|uniref:cache domain-containing protein n=1 Tax=Albimonas sp. CAU 1670 TaxID=3032599 RepID=UPI0023DBDC3E|nr:cache domain-containing protein [Albimonas sp. CAU 1670]MDF2234798.1 cache domain-containing protein [Albimonas sp. CAU 1670]
MASRALRPTLLTQFLIFVFASAAVVSAGLALAARDAAARFERAVLEEVTLQRANAVGRLFVRAIHSDWRDVATLAPSVSPGEGAAARPALDLVVGDGSRISWAGIAALDGTVTAASYGMLEGGSVAGRPWFDAGLRGPFAGDVHEAKLLAGLLPAGPDGAPPRFLDLAAPIPDADGRAIGVVGFHVNFAWAQAYLAETAAMVGIEAVVVDRDGTVVVGPAEMQGAAFDLASMRAATVGAQSTVVETWPDGVASLSAVAPSITYRDLPAFGWGLIARVDPALLAEQRAATTLRLDLGLAVAAAVFAAAGLIFGWIVARPFDRLSRSAEAIADGRDVYPEESRRTADLARFSHAISRLASRGDGTGR